MQVDTPTVDVLVQGMDINAPEKGAWVQNLFRRRRAWESRPGFGQLGQYDTTLGLPPAGTKEYGFRSCHGSYCVRTNFDHLQILSLWTGVVYTGNSTEAGQWQKCWFMLIYDVSTGRYHEQPLHNKTAGFNDNVKPMPYWRGVYETNINEELSDFLTSNNESCFFHEHGDNVLFGNRYIGLWSYIPSDFSGNRRKQVDGTNDRRWNEPYSESALLVQVAAVDGVFSNAFSYLTSDTYPRPDDACSFGDRVVLVSKHEVFFSDFGRPGSIMSRNVLFVPSDEELVGCEVVNDHLMLFTNNETWMYQPSLGETVTKGRLVQMSQQVGALNAACLQRVGGLLYHMDQRGVHVTTGASNPQEISGALKPLFDTSMSNPLYHYFANNGWSDLANAQPKAFYDLLQSQNVHACYESGNEQLFFTIPGYGISLVYHPPEQSWSVWNYESFASSNPAVVAATQNLPQPMLCAKDERLFMSCGYESYATQDQIVPPVDAIPLSVFFLEWGRGGSVDRSVDTTEDNRGGHGYYSGLIQSGNAGIMYVGEPIERSGLANEKLNRQSTLPDTYYLLPLYLHPNSAIGTATDGVSLRFTFDNSMWSPIFVDGVSAELDFLLPHQRWPSRTGWGYAAPTAGPPARRVECTDGVGASDRAGNQIRVQFDGPTAPGFWTHAGLLNLQPGKKNLLMFLPFQKLDPSVDVTSLDPAIADAQARPAGGVYADCDVWWFQKMNQGSRHGSDDVAQSIDWAYMTPEIKMQDSGVRLRGLAARIISHGSATAPLNPNWLYGVLNMAIGSDFKAWTSQLIDYAGVANGYANISEVRNKSSLRSRFMSSAVPSSLSRKVFGENLATWGNTSNSAHGNLLIDDESDDDIVLSDHVKGQFVTAMLFGHLRSRAEHVTLSSLRAIIQKRGGRRRRGR